VWNEILKQDKTHQGFKRRLEKKKEKKKKKKKKKSEKLERSVKIDYCGTKS
jgi:hypothetical protein